MAEEVRIRPDLNYQILLDDVLDALAQCEEARCDTEMARLLVQEAARMAHQGDFDEATEWLLLALEALRDGPPRLGPSAAWFTFPSPSSTASVRR